MEVLTGGGRSGSRLVRSNENAIVRPNATFAATQLLRSPRSLETRRFYHMGLPPFTETVWF